jgi:glycosyltransferase involved in cell wall biosynthesis
MRKIIVLGIAKNIANQVSILNDCIQSVLNLHEKSHAYIYENDSNDNTPEKLQEMAAKDSRITVVCEKSQGQTQTIASTWDNKQCRIETIANARNKCMKLWEENDSEESIVLWMDCDRVSRLDPGPIEFLANQLSEAPPNTVKGFFAFSKNHRGEMYDRYAYRDEAFPLGPELMGETWWKPEYQNALLKHIHTKSSNSLHSQVLSACNGLAIYKSDAIRGKRFSAYPTLEMEKYYRSLFRNEKHQAYSLIQTYQRKPTTHHEGVLLGKYVFGTEGMWYYNNSGYNQPVVCEWIPFNFAVRDGKEEGLFLIHGWVDMSGH